MGDQVTLETISDGINFSDEQHPSHNYSERRGATSGFQMSRMGAYDERAEVPIMVRGEGTRVYDAKRRRVLPTDCRDSSPTCSDRSRRHRRAAASR